MTHTESQIDPGILPRNLPILRCRLAFRMRQDTELPAFKGAMLRGGFGYAFQRAVCLPQCWGGDASQCTLTTICPYRRVFESTRPPGVELLHDLRDPPRPFVVELTTDQRTVYRAGESLEFGVSLIGNGINDLPYFLFGFAQLGEQGLGRQRAKALLDLVDALYPWDVAGTTIYREGRVIDSGDQMPVYDTATLLAQAQALPADLRLTFLSPTRIKSGGEFMRQIELMALVRAICWRLYALSIFYSTEPWQSDQGRLLADAQSVIISASQTHWVEQERRSAHRGPPQQLSIGGLVGSAILHGVSPALRALLLAGSLIHVGKACVFGNGAFQIEPA